MFKKIFLLLGLSLFLVACDSKTEKSLGYGEVSNGVYSNDYFKFSVNLPNDWVIQSQAALNEVIEKGSDVFAGDDEVLKSALKASEQDTVNMLAILKFEQGSPEPFNPSFIVVAENISSAPGVKTGADYHYHAKKLLQSGQIPYEFPNEIFSRDVSGVTFDVMPTQIPFYTSNIFQEYYATKINDHIFMFILSYSTESEKQELEAILSGVTLAE